MNDDFHYLFASPAGRHDGAAEAVFYKVEGSGVAEDLCALFTEDQADSASAGTSFHSMPAHTLTPRDRARLDEAIRRLDDYMDPGPRADDPEPDRDTLTRAQYAASAEAWKGIVRVRIGIADHASEHSPEAAVHRADLWRGVRGRGVRVPLSTVLNRGWWPDSKGRTGSSSLPSRSRSVRNPTVHAT